MSFGESFGVSFQGDQYTQHFWSGFLSDGGLLNLPLAVVSQMKLTEAYSLPPVGTTAMKAIVDVHDDTIELTVALVGPERYALKLLLETMAEASRRGSALATYTGGKVGGLILVTSMTIRTDLVVKQLVFTASATRRDTLDVVITFAYVPLPSALGKLLDVASVGVGALADAFAL